MTSSLLLLMLVTAVFVSKTMLNGLPTCPLRHRYGTELKMSSDECIESSSCPIQFKSLYIANLDPQVSEGILIQMLSGFGKITRSILAKNHRGEPRGFAFVEFESTHSAEQAVEHMNGRLIGDSETALNVQSQNPKLRTCYMNVLFGIIRKLYHKRSLSDSELSKISNGLYYLTQAGFKVEWLWSKLDTEKKERDACEARIVELKQEVKKLEGAMCGLKAELSKISNGLSYLTQAGFKVGWLWSKLDRGYFKRKKRNGCEARIVELKQEVEKLERTMSGVKAKLRNEKAKLNPNSFRNFFRSFF